MSVEIKHVDYRRTVPPLTGIRITRAAPLTGTIKRILPHFPGGCFIAGTPILMKDNTEKAIEKVKIEEKVLCHNSYGTVTKTFSRQYSGEIIVIKPRGSREVHVTPEHPFLSVKRRKREFPEVKPEWVNAKNLREGYWLISPVPSRSEDVEKIDLTSFIDFRGYDSKGNVYGSYNTEHLLYGATRKRIKKLGNGMIRYKYSKKTIPRLVNLTNNFLRLIGYYLAEGNPLYDSKNYEGGYTPPRHPTGLLLSFGIKEKDLVNDAAEIIKDTFGFQPTIIERESKNTIKVQMNSVPIAMLFKKLCGEHSERKRMHKLLMLLPPEKQKHIIEGIHLGDNSDDLRKGVKGILLKNKVLIRQVWTIINRLRKKPAQYKNGLAQSVMWKDEWQKHDRFYFKDWLITPIATIREYPYDGAVYNLEVSPYNSYVANKIAVHNCNGLVFLRFGIEREGKGQIWPSPTETYLALDDWTPSMGFELNEYVEKGDEMWLDVINRDMLYPHTPVIVVEIRGEERE